MRSTKTTHAGADPYNFSGCHGSLGPSSPPSGLPPRNRDPKRGLPTGIGSDSIVVALVHTGLPLDYTQRGATGIRLCDLSSVK